MTFEEWLKSIDYKHVSGTTALAKHAWTAGFHQAMDEMMVTYDQGYEDGLIAARSVGEKDNEH